MPKKKEKEVYGLDGPAIPNPAGMGYGLNRQPKPKKQAKPAKPK